MTLVYLLTGAPKTRWHFGEMGIQSWPRNRPRGLCFLYIPLLKNHWKPAPGPGEPGGVHFLFSAVAALTLWLPTLKEGSKGFMESSVNKSKKSHLRLPRLISLHIPRVVWQFDFESFPDPSSFWLWNRRFKPKGGLQSFLADKWNMWYNPNCWSYSCKVSVVSMVELVMVKQTTKPWRPLMPWILTMAGVTLWSFSRIKSLSTNFWESSFFLRDRNMLEVRPLWSLFLATRSSAEVQIDLRLNLFEIPKEWDMDRYIRSSMIGWVLRSFIRL